MESNLPRGWVDGNLSELVDYKKGKKPKRMESSKFEGSLVYLDIKAIEKGKDENYVDRESSNHTNETELIIVWDGARAGWVSKSRYGAIGSTIMALKPKIERDYLLRFLQTQFSYIQSNHRGTGIPHVDPDIFWNIKIPLAPIKEQSRIIAKLDTLFAKIESNKQRLEKIPQILKRFRQSVLAAAVSGRLTNKIEDNHIPETWNILNGNEVFEFITSGSRGWAEYYREEGKLFIRVTNLNYDTIKIDTSPFKNKYVTPPQNAEGTRTKVKVNDILISITGDVGMVGLVEDGFDETYINQHVCLARPREGFYSKYIAYYISAMNGGRKYFDEVKKGATKSGLGLNDIRDLPISFPPIEEQQEIVLRVEQLFAFADKIEARYTKAKAILDKVPQSILAKAFRGELVQQDPYDEPASVLLERIKREKMKSQNKKTKKP